MPRAVRYGFQPRAFQPRPREMAGRQRADMVSPRRVSRLKLWTTLAVVSFCAIVWGSLIAAFIQLA